MAYDALDDPEIREVAAVAGVQGGKTILGALGLRKLIERYPKGYNWIVGANNYKTLSQATIPTFKKVFTKVCGRYVQNREVFELSKKMGGGNVYFRTATDPDSPEGIPECKGGWIDEAGKCSRAFKVNILGRVARLQGKVLYTSTPYALNWLWTEVEKPFKSGERRDIFFVQWESKDNPSFPEEEYERQKRILDRRTFNRKYRGLHERMEGLVYELSQENWMDPFDLPRDTRIFASVDFGFVEGHEFALSIRAIAPDGFRYVINTFKQAGLDPNAQVMLAKAKQEIFKIEHFYCDPARPDMIAAFNKASLKASGFQTGAKDYKRIVPGITKHNELIRSGRYKLFRGRCLDLEDEYETYHWPETRDGIVKKEVPVPVNDQLMDCERMLTVGTMHLEPKSKPSVQTRLKSQYIDRFDPTKKKPKNWDAY